MAEYAVVDKTYLLPFDDAVELMRLLSRAQKVTTSWGTDKEPPYKYVMSGGELNLTLLTTAQHAQMELERDK